MSEEAQSLLDFVLQCHCSSNGQRESVVLISLLSIWVAAGKEPQAGGWAQAFTSRQVTASAVTIL